MALILEDRVKETTTVTGTGTATLLGAATGFQSFSVIGNGNTTYYCIAGQGTSEWEVGIGTYTSSGTTLARTTVISSSNSNAAVNFSAGTKDVFATYAASTATLLDDVQTLTNKTLTSPIITDGTVDGVKIGFRNIPAVGTKTSSYSLTTSDVGKYVQLGSGGSITIPDATFSEGDVVSIFNNTTGNITLTCSITTAYIAGTDTDKSTMTLATRGVATVLFISGTVCVVSGNVT